MQSGERLLLSGGLLTGAAALLHIGIIIGGPDWYRFFGAGEQMALRAARGSAYPSLVTAVIAAMLAVWALYGFSGAGVIGRLPFLQAALAMISSVYLARGILGIPIVLFMDSRYANELKGRMTFMVVTSAVCVFLGFCYGAGAVMVRRRRLTQPDRP